MVVRIYVSKKSVHLKCFFSKREEKFAFSPHVRRPGEAFLDQVGIWNLCPSTKIYIKCWNRNIFSLGMPTTSLNATPNITHSAIASQDSSRVMMTFKAHCTVHSEVGDLNVIFANQDAESGRYRTVLCAWYHVQEWNVLDHGSATGSAVYAVQ